MPLSLNKAIAQCPRSMFGKKGVSNPDFPGIFATVAKAMLTDAGVKFSESTVDALAEIINPSTFQRQVAARRATYTGKKNDDGTYDPIEEKKPRKVAPQKAAKPAGAKPSKEAALVRAREALAKARATKKAGKKPAPKKGKGKPVEVADDDVI